MSQDGPQNAPDDPDLPSFPIAFKFTQDGLADQIAQSGSLDVKANFVLGAATTLIATILTLQTVFPLPQTLASSRLILQIILLILYLATMVSGFIAYWLRAYKEINPVQLADKYLTWTTVDTNRAIYTGMVEDYKVNDNILKAKVLWLEVSFTLLLLEALGVVIVLFVQFLDKLFP